MSRLMFVDMPGAERLAMDPEVLLLREGVLLNKSLLDFSRGKQLPAPVSAGSRCSRSVLRLHQVPLVMCLSMVILMFIQCSCALGSRVCCVA